MFTIEHSSWQCNILFDKVSDHNSYFQVCNATCKMTIHRAINKGMIQNPGWHLRSAKEQFNMRRNNSRCKMTHNSPREQFNMRCDNLNMHRDNATFDITIQPTIQHACGNWVRKWPALLAPGNRTDPGEQKYRWRKRRILLHQIFIVSPTV